MKFTLIFSFMLLAIAVGCTNKSDETQIVRDTPAESAPNNEEQLTDSPGKILDSGESRDVQVSTIPKGKIYIEITSNIITDLSGRTLILKEGDIQAHNTCVPSGVSCSLELKSGVQLKLGAQYQINWLSFDGYGYGDGNGATIHSNLTFDVSDTDFNSIRCDYIGSDILFAFTIRDLDKAFGKWFKVVRQ